MEQFLEKGDSVVYGDFANILKSTSRWTLGSHRLEDGSTWLYREPDAAIVVQNGRLKVKAAPFTRAHPTLQTLDNAKHMYFSRERFEVPPEGDVAVEVDMRVAIQGARPGDIYDAFVTLNLLDLQTGISADWFLGGDQCATVYARVHLPGTEVSEDNGAHPRYFSIFNEIDLPQPREEFHRFRIRYSRAQDTLTWSLDDHEVNRETEVPVKVSGFTAALGLMTQKDLRSSGSVSLHGQGASGEWSPLRITRYNH